MSRKSKIPTVSRLIHAILNWDIESPAAAGVSFYGAIEVPPTGTFFSDLTTMTRAMATTPASVNKQT